MPSVDFPTLVLLFNWVQQPNRPILWPVELDLKDIYKPQSPLGTLHKPHLTTFSAKRYLAPGSRFLYSEESLVLKTIAALHI